MKSATADNNDDLDSFLDTELNDEQSEDAGLMNFVDVTDLLED